MRPQWRISWWWEAIAIVAVFWAAVGLFFYAQKLLQFMLDSVRYMMGA